MAGVFYLVTFLAGLALAVHSMLHGVERWRRKHSAKPSPVLNPPTVAAMLVGFGACGYLLATRSALGGVAILLIAIATGAASLAGMIMLMAKWALRPQAGAHTSDEDDVHGQVATVSRAITAEGNGEITWFAWGAMHSLPARSMDGAEIPESTEVVIEAVEHGVARVELWSVVEQRL